ncbi:tetratricopeptide repeat protein [Chitinophaga niabensis]|uniref:Tetratricopeptide repeat-containing protein n=1 Tax=Chitinophaga niabensis TaxID=536979 RepID=A0A1N6FT51_9BACT|nr:hypothetical protein [Chitinophaga niabensis]SIN98475.1 hypothetical protein SAMN04488055_2399 [Chitinophaga niabensis]
MLKKTILLFLTCWVSISLQAQTVEELFAQAQLLEKQMKDAEALVKYKEVLQVSPGHVPSFNQASLICGREGARQKDKAQKLEYFNQAKIYAFEALKVEPENPVANYAMAMSWAYIGAISGAKEKVAAYSETKKYADLAIKFKPDYAEPYHLLGRWNYELANFNGIEKAAAKVLFGGVPPGTIEGAITSYEKCNQLKASIIQNYLDLAIAFKHNNQETQAMEVLNKGLRLRPIIQDDQIYKAEMKKMLDAMQ